MQAGSLEPGTSRLAVRRPALLTAIPPLLRTLGRSSASASQSPAVAWIRLHPGAGAVRHDAGFRETGPMTTGANGAGGVSRNTDLQARSGAGQSPGARIDSQVIEARAC